jgi:hypothetical protein
VVFQGGNEVRAIFDTEPRLQCVWTSEETGILCKVGADVLEPLGWNLASLARLDEGEQLRRKLLPSNIAHNLKYRLQRAESAGFPHADWAITISLNQN